MNTFKNTDYENWFVELKSTIQQRQIKASIAVNSELILLYWELGKQICQKQDNHKWGSGFMDQLSKDLKADFPEMNGFSKRNLELVKQWFLFYSQIDTVAKQLVSQNDIVDLLNTKQVVSQLKNNDFFDFFIRIPWGHHILIIQKIKNSEEAFFYIKETIKNNWSRSVLEYQIETKLVQRQGKVVSNFENTLPKVQSDLANELFKDPYNFEFLTLRTSAKEKDLETTLIKNITQFLLELGKGFAYMGRQYLLQIGNKEYRTDLLFYHTKLRCFIIIELKTKEFEPEFIGKLNFYVSAVNELLKNDSDNPTIGILLCKNKDNFEVEFALKDVHKPIGVSEYHYKELPEEIRAGLPTVEELNNELKKIKTE